MAALQEIIQWCNDTLKTHEFKDYAPNGLQIEGKSEVKKLSVLSPPLKKRLMQPLHNKRISSWFIMAIFGKEKPTRLQACAVNVLKPLSNMIFP